MRPPGGPGWGEESTESLRQALDDGRLVAILPVGAVEPHGPHLPISTDIVIAEEMSSRAARRLAARGVGCRILPPVAYSVADWSAGFPGRVSLSSPTARAVIVEICRAVEETGARIALANAHLEPAHVAVLRDACRDVVAKGGVEPVFADVTRRRLAERLGEAFRSGDHAGAYETSLVMAARPDLVREEIRLRLPRVDVSLVEKIRQGVSSFREAGMESAYCGNPASATAEEGERLYECLGQLLEEAVLDALEADGESPRPRS